MREPWNTLRRPNWSECKGTAVHSEVANIAMRGESCTLLDCISRCTASHHVRSCGSFALYYHYIAKTMLPLWLVWLRAIRCAPLSLASHSVGCLQNGVENEKHCRMSTRHVLIDVEDCVDYWRGASRNSLKGQCMLSKYGVARSSEPRARINPVAAICTRGNGTMLDFGNTASMELQ